MPVFLTLWFSSISRSPRPPRRTVYFSLWHCPHAALDEWWSRPLTHHTICHWSQTLWWATHINSSLHKPLLHDILTSFPTLSADEGLWDILIKDIPKEVTSYTLNLDMLREGVTYDFRVIAVNDYGYGSPSAPSPSISGTLTWQVNAQLWEL